MTQRDGASDLVNAEEARKAHQALMRSIESGDLLILGMRLDTLMGYVNEIRQRGLYTVERALEDFAEIQRLKARVRQLEAELEQERAWHNQ